MIKRIFIKALSLTNSFIGELHYLLEKKGLLKPVEYSVYKKIEGKVKVEIKYPINYDKKDEALFDHYTGYDTNDLIVYKFEDVNVSIDGIVFNKFNNSWLSFPHIVFRVQYGWLYFLNQYIFRKKELTDPDKTYVLLFDFWSNNYYHWLIDSLPRLLMLKEELKGKDFVLLLPETCSKFTALTLKYFDINQISYIRKGTYLKTKDLLLPYYTAGSGHIHPEFVNEVQSHLLKRIKSSSGKERVYVSRGKQKARRLLNEAAVIEMVLGNGFEVVYFEDLTFEDQVAIGKSAKVMITSHGANLTNSMFMQPGTKVLELIRNDNPNFCYWALCSVLKIDYYYQLCKVEGNDHLLVDTELFSKNLKKILE